MIALNYDDWKTPIKHNNFGKSDTLTDTNGRNRWDRIRVINYE